MSFSEDRKTKVWSVVRVSSGNFLEMYDFMVFGYYATAIGNAFFPSGNPVAWLRLSLMTFGAGFLMRPLGAIVLGAYADHHGRRAGLMLTLGLMSVGILSIACMPGYATIGLLAPLFVLIGRLLQGFSAGMELGGVSVYLSLKRLLHPILNSLGLTRTGWRSFRRSVATALSEMREPVRTAQQVLGHSSPQTTLAYYVQTIEDSQRNAIAQLEKLMFPNVPKFEN